MQMRGAKRTTIRQFIVEVVQIKLPNSTVGE